MENSKITPKEITQDIDTGLNVASFDFYSGVIEARSRNLKQSMNLEKDTFIVCCGDVMFIVTSKEYPETKRRVF